MPKHTILFLAANPVGTDRLALDKQAQAIRVEFERSDFRESFALETRWAAAPLDLLRELRKLRPTVVHFCGHGTSDVAGAPRAPAEPHRDVVVADGPAAPSQHGLYFQGLDGGPQLVSAEAFAQVFGAAGSSVKLVTLSACYSDQQAAALVAHVDCVVGMRGSIRDDAARSFAIGFYGGLGEGESVAAAYRQGCAAIGLEGLLDVDKPRLMVGDGVDAELVVLADIARGDLATGSRDLDPPTPAYASAGVQALRGRLDEARARKQALRALGVATDEVDQEIRRILRQQSDGEYLLVGATLSDGRYVLVNRVGHGGFAVVWEAHDRTENRRVALKALHPHLTADLARRERFFRGARIMMTLIHPAVVRVYQPKGESDTLCYFVMEFVRGGTLRDAVIAKRVDAPRALSLILQVGDALAEAHGQHLVHRDIKPSNILLDELGNAKLTDFDLVSARDTVGGTRHPIGTVGYAAPELLERLPDNPEEPTARADVFSLGMTAIFCLSGQDLSVTAYRNLEATVERLNCSTRVKEVLAQAVSWEPDRRFVDAAAMVDALRTALDPANDPCPRPWPEIRLGKAVRQNEKMLHYDLEAGKPLVGGTPVVTGPRPMIEGPIAVLKMQVQDQNLRADNISVDLYFDTFDVRRALLGMWDYVQSAGPGKLVLDEAAFGQRNALVAALLASGYLGSFHMLPPHQSELRRQLESSQAFAGTRDRGGRREQDEFFSALGLLRSTDASGPCLLSTSGKADWDALVDAHSQDAPRLFTAVQCARATWWERLQQWEDRGLLWLDVPPFTTKDIVRRDEFPAALDAFAQLRDGSTGEVASNKIKLEWVRTYNDFADAVALLSLVALTEAYNSGTRNAAPRFYDSFGSFAKAAEASGVAHRLRIVTRDGLDTPVLVNDAYFIFRASFQSAADHSQQPLQGVDLGSIYELFDGFQDDAHALDGTRLERGLSEKLQNLGRAGFLTNVWLRTAAVDELRDLVDRLRTERQETRQQEYQEALRGVIQRTKAQLESNFAEYRHLSTLWASAKEALGKLHKEFQRRNRPIVPIRDFRLIRFGLSPKGIAQVDQIMTDLLDPRIENADLRAQESWQVFIDCYYEAATEKPGSPDKAEVAAAVMWCLSALPFVIELLRGYVYTKPEWHSLAAMYAEACFEQPSQVEEGRHVLARLEAELAASEEPGGNKEALLRYVQHCIAAAYLNFHLWLIERRPWDWRHPQDGVTLAPAVRERIERAITHASAACRAVTDASKSELLRPLAKYAQNQRLYYLLELGDPARASEIRDAYLYMTYEPEVWMWAFEDTLARYFAFEAIWCDDAETWAELMEDARKKALAADDGGPPVRVHADHSGWLVQAQSRGFEDRLAYRQSFKKLAK